MRSPSERFLSYTEGHLGRARVMRLGLQALSRHPDLGLADHARRVLRGQESLESLLNHPELRRLAGPRLEETVTKVRAMSDDELDATVRASHQRFDRARRDEEEKYR